MVGFFSVGILPVGILPVGILLGRHITWSAYYLVGIFLGRHITWSAFCFLVGIFTWSVFFRSANTGRLFAGWLLT
jgi:hypothetical protein